MEDHWFKQPISEVFSHDEGGDVRSSMLQFFTEALVPSIMGLEESLCGTTGPVPDQPDQA